MLPRYFLALAALAGGGALGSAACGGSGALSPPTSDSQYDDPDDPGSGGATNGPAPPVDAGAAPVALPAGSGGIGFDDMRFSGTLSKLLIPAGRTGNLVLLDPSTEDITVQGGFSSSATYGGNDSFGATSADEGNGIVYVTDRTTSTLSVIDPSKGAVVATAPLAGVPGYVRYSEPTNEVWVTEPALGQIEIFTVPASATTAPAHAATVAVPGGPESLEIDLGSKRAYTHATTATVAIDLAARSVVGQWPNGCMTSKGIAVDSNSGWVISACAEGKVFVLSTAGTTLGSVTTIAGVDQVTYDPMAQRLYVPSSTASALGIVSIASNGVPTLAGSLSALGSGACAVTAGGGAVFVCVPSQGDLLFLHDPF